MLDLLLVGQKTAPNFFWDARGGVLLTGMSFTRGSSGWYFNSSGVLTSASSNVARFDYDPTTLTPLGYLAEMQSTNRWLWSQNLANANLARVTVTPNVAGAPDGTATVSRVFETAVTGDHSPFLNFNLPANTTRGFSAFARAGTRSSFSLYFGGQTAGVGAGVVFDLSNGVVSQTFQGATSGTLVSSGMTNCGGGWYRCWIQAQISDSTNFGANIQLAPAATGNTFGSSGAISYLGDTSKYVDFWGVQLDTDGVGVTSYIPTAGSTVTRSADILTLPLTALPGWNVSKGGVLAAIVRLPTLAPSAVTMPMRLDDGTGSNSVLMGAYQGGANRRYTVVFSGGTEFDALGTNNPPAVFVRTKQAAGWGVGRSQGAADGVLFGLNTSASIALPIGLTTLRFNSDGNSIIESAAFYPGARSDAFVQGVSR